MLNFVIYKLTSPSGKVYIGRTNDFDHRMDTHKYNFKKRKMKSINFHLYNAIAKHGWDNFTKEIIDTAETLEEAITKELEYIVKFNSVIEGYNGTYETKEGGDIWEGKRDTLEYAEFVKKMIELTTGENNGMYGKTHSEDAKSKQKDKAKGRFSLAWFIDRYGEDLGTTKYNDRCKALKARKLPVDINGRFIPKMSK